MTAILRLPKHFQDGMILQQQAPFHLYGWCAAQACVQVRLERKPFDGRAVSPLDSQYGIIFKETAQADENGAFSFAIPAREASYDPHELVVSSGTQTAVLREVLFGEVWIAAGQSNMQMPLWAIQTPAETEMLANVHYVRVLGPAAAGPDEPGKEAGLQSEIVPDPLKWRQGDHPEAVSGVSAVGFSFARRLHLDLKLPVGLIELALGGTPIHAWISRTSIDHNKKINLHLADLGFGQSQGEADPAWICEGGHQPAHLYESRVEPLKGLAVRGMLWYQGESDYLYPAYYREALQALVTDWQQIFRPAGQNGLAFLMVQLAPFFYGHARFTQLAEFNEMLAAMRHRLTCPAALLPVYDLPLDYAEAAASWRHPIHPRNKLPIGERLERMSLGLLYQRKAPHTAPECSNIEIVGNKMILSFSQIGEGLRLAGQGVRLRGFAICGPDRVFMPANARILYGVRVMVWHDQITSPQAVSYGFADMNQEANLVSRDGLPVVPFRSDRQPAAHCPPMEWLHCDSLHVWCSPDQQDVSQTGWHPRWRFALGEGQLAVEPANKLSGDGSLFIRYKTDEQQQAAVEPVLHYASLFPPLDLSACESLDFSLFNPDQHMKSVRLALAAGKKDAPLVTLSKRAVVIAALRWQDFSFPLAETGDLLDRVYRIVLIVEDKKKRGEIYLDLIRLIRSKATGAVHDKV